MPPVVRLKPGDPDVAVVVVAVVADAVVSRLAAIHMTNRRRAFFTETARLVDEIMAARRPPAAIRFRIVCSM